MAGSAGGKDGPQAGKTGEQKLRRLGPKLGCHVAAAVVQIAVTVLVVVVVVKVKGKGNPITGPGGCVG